MGIRKPQLKSRWQKALIVVLPCIFLGLMMLVGGIGKLPGLYHVLGEFPGQTEFIDAILGSLWTPTVASFFSDVLPWIEVTLGVALVLGIFSRIAAVLTLPLIAGFMASNIWAISHGEAFGSCGCFGIFEKLFGNTTPIQALGLDVIMLFLAIIIILFHPAGFFTFRWWFSKKKGE